MQTGEKVTIDRQVYTYVRPGRPGHWLLSPSGTLVHIMILPEEYEEFRRMIQPNENVDKGVSHRRSQKRTRKRSRG